MLKGPLCIVCVCICKYVRNFEQEIKKSKYKKRNKQFLNYWYQIIIDNYYKRTKTADQGEACLPFSSCWRRPREKINKEQTNKKGTWKPTITTKTNVVGVQTVKSLRRLSCKFDPDQSQDVIASQVRGRKSWQAKDFVRRPRDKEIRNVLYSRFSLSPFVQARLMEASRTVSKLKTQYHFTKLLWKFPSALRISMFSFFLFLRLLRM